MSSAIGAGAGNETGAVSGTVAGTGAVANNPSKQIIQEGLNTVKSWSTPPRVYIYCGHGADKCDKMGNPIIEKVPNDSIYITFTECGDVIYYDTLKKTDSTFFSDDPIIDYSLSHPEKTTSLKSMATTLQYKESSIHVHLPGMNYVVAEFSPFSFIEAYKEDFDFFGIAQSGLVDRQVFLDKKFEYKDFHIYRLKISFPLSKLKKQDAYDYVYKKIDESENKRVAYQAKKFLEKTGKLNKDAANAYLDKKHPGPGTTLLDALELQSFYDEYMYTVPKSYILDCYNGSVHPTREKVSKIIENHYRGVEEITLRDVRALSYRLHKLYKKSDLMVKFPGIHYNKVCRSVHKKCEPKMMTRRKMSLNQETLRRNITRKLNNKNTIARIVAQENTTAEENTITPQTPPYSAAVETAEEKAIAPQTPPYSAAVETAQEENPNYMKNYEKRLAEIQKEYDNTMERLRKQDEEYQKNYNNIGKRFSIQKSFSGILRKRYATFHDKQVAIYNSLLTMRQKVDDLGQKAKEELVQFLEEQGILRGSAPITKKIRHLIHPTKYSRGGSFTRKL